MRLSDSHTKNEVSSGCAYIGAVRIVGPFSIDLRPKMQSRSCVYMYDFEEFLFQYFLNSETRHLRINHHRLNLIKRT